MPMGAVSQGTFTIEHTYHQWRNNRSPLRQQAGVPFCNSMTVRVAAGFANTTVGILNLWFDHHFPLAYTVGSALETMGGAAQLHFMAQSWIVSLYVDCPLYAGLHCPNATALANFNTSVSKGWITWHAFPFNSELELLDTSLLGYGINMTHELDDQFGVRRKTVLSQRDVPGMTRSVIPTLAANGVRAITVGVNGASTPPSVPRAFMWR